MIRGRIAIPDVVLSSGSWRAEGDVLCAAGFVDSDYPLE